MVNPWSVLSLSLDFQDLVVLIGYMLAGDCQHIDTELKIPGGKQTWMHYYKPVTRIK
jgi:hypothetical protein